MGCGVKRWESPVQESVWGRGNCPRVEEEGRTAGPGLCAGPDGLWRYWERGWQVWGQQGVKKVRGL